MIAERLRECRWKKERIAVTAEQSIDDILQQFYGDESLKDPVQNHESVESFFDRAKTGAKFQSSLSTALSSLSMGGQSIVSLLGHGGAFCAHCVTSVGSSIGGVSTLSMPGVGVGHWHGDHWHEDDHDEEDTSKFGKHAHATHTPKSPQRNVLPKKAHTQSTQQTESISLSIFVSSWFCGVSVY